MSDNLLTVTIGRNVGNTPMSSDDWARFQSDILGLVTLATTSHFGPFFGTGVWEGVSEDSTVFTGILNDGVNLTDFPDAFSSLLQTYARKYGQDAIAWSVGRSHLATR